MMYNTSRLQMWAQMLRLWSVVAQPRTCNVCYSYSKSSRKYLDMPVDIGRISVENIAASSWVHKSMPRM